MSQSTKNSLPSIAIKYHRSSLIFLAIILWVFFLTSIYAIFFTPADKIYKFFSGIIAVLIGIYALRETLKLIRTIPPLIIDNLGMKFYEKNMLPWEEITSISTEPMRHGGRHPVYSTRLVFTAHDNKKYKIDDYTLTHTAKQILAEISKFRKLEYDAPAGVFRVIHY